MPTRIQGPLVNTELSRGDREWFSNLPHGRSPDLCLYMNDFLNTADYAATDWTITTTEAGAGDATEAIAANEPFGALKITNDDAANDLDTLQLNEETWRTTVGKRMWFESRLKLSAAATSTAFIGLGVTDTTPLTTSDRVGFQVTTGSALIYAKNGTSSTETGSSTSSGVSAVDDTYNTLGFYWDGAKSIKFFVDRALVATHTVNIPTTQTMAVTLYLKNGAAAAQSMTIDYIFVAAER